jgi:hypothetical protein
MYPLFLADTTIGLTILSERVGTTSFRLILRFTNAYQYITNKAQDYSRGFLSISLKLSCVKINCPMLRQMCSWVKSICLVLFLFFLGFIK